MHHLSTLIFISSGLIVFSAAVSEYLSEVVDSRKYLVTIVLVVVGTLICLGLIIHRSKMPKVVVNVTYLTVCAVFLYVEINPKLAEKEILRLILLLLVSVFFLSRGVVIHLQEGETQRTAPDN